MQEVEAVRTRDFYIVHTHTGQQQVTRRYFEAGFIVYFYEDQRVLFFDDRADAVEEFMDCGEIVSLITITDSGAL